MKLDKKLYQLFIGLLILTIVIFLVLKYKSVFLKYKSVKENFLSQDELGNLIPQVCTSTNNISCGKFNYLGKYWLEVLPPSDKMFAMDFIRRKMATFAIADANDWSKSDAGQRNEFFSHYHATGSLVGTNRFVEHLIYEKIPRYSPEIGAMEGDQYTWRSKEYFLCFKLVSDSGDSMLLLQGSFPPYQGGIYRGMYTGVNVAPADVPFVINHLGGYTGVPKIGTLYNFYFAIGKRGIGNDSGPQGCGKPPAINCAVSDWSPYGPCNTSCGPGTKTRTRTITTQPANGGTACPPLSESIDCGNPVCAVNCVARYDRDGTCSKPCGGGVQRLRKVIVTPAIGAGTCSEPDFKQEPCNSQPCRNCVVRYDKDGTCSKTCGGGVQKLKKVVVTPAEGDGTCNDPDFKEEPCNTQTCRECVVRYDKDGDCSKPCNGGVQKLKKVIVTPAEGDGLCNYPDFKEEACNTQVCKDCIVSGWTKDGTCSKQCGGGKQKFTRSITTPAEGDGNCVTDFTKEEDCNVPPCPIDCKPGQWQNADGAKCIVDPDKPKNCGPGMGRIKQVRSVVPANSTGKCSDEDSKTEQYVVCDLPECPIDCDPGTWSSWSSCKGECGTGIRTRTKNPKEANSTGRKCTAEELVAEEKEQCKLPPCPIDCKANAWSNWSECSGSCGPGGGISVRTRRVDQANETGRKCTAEESKTREEMTCDMPDCPIHCEVGPWSAWGPSEPQNGMNMRKRTRKVVLGNATGTPCSPDQSKTVEYKPCNSEKTNLPDLLDLQNKGFSGIKIFYHK